MKIAADNLLPQASSVFLPWEWKHREWFLRDRSVWGWRTIANPKALRNISRPLFHASKCISEEMTSTPKASWRAAVLRVHSCTSVFCREWKESWTWVCGLMLSCWAALYQEEDSLTPVHTRDYSSCWGPGCCLQLHACLCCWPRNLLSKAGRHLAQQKAVGVWARIRTASKEEGEKNNTWKCLLSYLLG